MIILKWFFIIAGIELFVFGVYTANTNAEGYHIINGVVIFAGVVMFLGGLICWLLRRPRKLYANPVRKFF